MKTQMLPNDWHILSAWRWSVALLVLILLPLVWLGTLPIRLNVTTLQSVFDLLTPL
jgi:hypothetical protein